jgi:hypothetical protein
MLDSMTIAGSFFFDDGPAYEVEVLRAIEAEVCHLATSVGHY